MSEQTESEYSLLKAAALTTEELERRVVAEMRALDASEAGMRLALHPAAAFAIVAFCQLALRHPAAAAQYDAAASVKQFIEYVRAKFEPHAPAIALAIERGNLPEHDPPRYRHVDGGMRPGDRAVFENPRPAPSSPRMDGSIDGRGLLEFILASETPRTPAEVLEFLDSRRDPAPAVLTCPYCGHSERAMFKNVDVYICAKCGRTIETA